MGYNRSISCVPAKLVHETGQVRTHRHMIAVSLMVFRVALKRAQIWYGDVARLDGHEAVRLKPCKRTGDYIANRANPAGNLVIRETKPKRHLVVCCGACVLRFSQQKQRKSLTDFVKRQHLHKPRMFSHSLGH